MTREAEASMTMMIIHNSYHRPRCSVTEVKVLGSGPNWADLLVIAGGAAYFFRAKDFDREHGNVDQDNDSQRIQKRRRKGKIRRPSVTLSAEIGFNTTVLRTAVGKSREYPWLFALTLSGIEVSD